MKLIIGFLFMCLSGTLIAQYPYEVSAEHPFGLPNPEAPQELLDFAPLIGECNCSSEKRGLDGNWTEPVNMIWRFKYIMNGMAVQDETLKADGTYAGSIRQFIPDSTKWYVHYYSSGSPSPVLPSWEGNKNDEGDIVLYRDQKAPNGMEGDYKIVFSEISEKGFNWLGAWVSKDRSTAFPTWKISCTKIGNEDRTEDREIVLKAAAQFSKAYMAGDYEALADIYTKDAKIFPGNAPIIGGRQGIIDRFMIPEGSKIIFHEIRPEEINFIGNYAYDYGYYEGKTQNAKGDISSWKGKYVVVWKKKNAQWKMYLDIWNRVSDNN